MLERRRGTLTIQGCLIASVLGLPITMAACGSDPASSNGKSRGDALADDDDSDDDSSSDSSGDDDAPSKDKPKTSTKDAGGGKSGSDAGAGRADASNGTKAGGIPCDVAKVLETHCAECHGDEPQFGAPMSLIDHDDFHTKGVVTKSKQVDALVEERINDTKKPMPPGSAKPMPAADKAKLMAWLEDGAPAGKGSDSCVVKTPAIDEKPDDKPANPDATCYKLMNHGKAVSGDTSKYPVGPGEHYAEFYFDAPWKEPSVMVSFRTIYDDTRLLHHWLMYQHQGLQADGAIGVGIGSHIGGAVQLLAGWAVGGDDIVVPDGIAAKMPPPGGKLMIEWHYYNQTNQMQMDSSGVEVCVVPASKIDPKKVASLTWVGNENLGGSSLGGVIGLGGMPPGKESKAQDTCTPRFTGLAAGEPVRIFSFTPHMHKLGRHMRTWVVRKDGKVQKVFDKEFVFDHQSSYRVDPEIELYPGDKLVNECTFYNDTSKAVGFGPSSDQEMCYQFTYAYPAGALVNGVSSLTGATNTCWDNKPADAAKYIQMAP